MNNFQRAKRLISIFGFRRMIRANRQPEYDGPGFTATTARALFGIPADWAYSDEGLRLYAAGPGVSDRAAWEAVMYLFDLHYNPDQLRELEGARARQAASNTAYHAKMAELDRFR